MPKVLSSVKKPVFSALATPANSVGGFSLNSSKQSRTEQHPPGFGSVYYHASSLSPCCGSVASSTNTSSFEASSVEVVVSDLDKDDLTKRESISSEESMSETEKAIREIISETRRKVEKERPVELRESITAIIEKKKEEERELEEKRVKLKRRILEEVARRSCDLCTETKDSARRTSVDRKTSPSSLSFTSAKTDSHPSVHPFLPLSLDRASEASYHTEVSQRGSRLALEKGGKRREDIWKASNRKIVRNALLTVCLCGERNKKLREEVLEKMEQCKDTSLFVIAFKGVFSHHSFAALYAHDLQTTTLTKVVGPSLYPPTLSLPQITACYRYDSSAREFKLSPLKRVTLGTDAVSVLIRRK